MNQKWLKNYFQRYLTVLENMDVSKFLIKIKSLFEITSKKNGKIIFLGNGGSAAIANHCSVDLTKNARIRAINFNDPGLITCLANDFGHELWMAKAIEYYSSSNDTVVLISSSGNSKNIVNGAYKARDLNLNMVTFTGFKKDNKLKSMGSINIWVNSKAYNIVENMHQIYLLSIVDMLIGNAEYSA